MHGAARGQEARVPRVESYPVCVETMILSSSVHLVVVQTRVWERRTRGVERDGARGKVSRVSMRPMTSHNGGALSICHGLVPSTSIFTQGTERRFICDNGHDQARS